MGIMGALGAGVAGAAGAAEKIGLEQIQAMIDEDKQKALLQMREESQKRLTQHAADVQLDTRQRESDQDEINAPRVRARKVADETAVGTARANVEREAKKGQMQDALDFTTTNRKDLAANERALAQARHIVDPSFTYKTDENGLVFAIDQRNPKNAVQVNGPDGKPLKATDPEEMRAITTAVNGINKKYHEDLLSLKAESANAFDEAAKKAVETKVRTLNEAYAREIKPYNDAILKKSGIAADKGVATGLDALLPPKEKQKAQETQQKATAPTTQPAKQNVSVAQTNEPTIVAIEPAGTTIMGGKQFIAKYSDGSSRVLSGHEAERQNILLNK